jgi:hypothetical protein
MPKYVPMLGLLVFAFTQVCWSQDARGPGYRNSDPPNCGSFYTRTIHGIITAQDGSRLKDVEVEVFDDSSHQSLRKTVTNEAGRFSLGKLQQGRYRVVFSFPGFLTQDWAVTTASWPEGGFFQSRAMREVLPISLGDSESPQPCRSEYSR